MVHLSFLLNRTEKRKWSIFLYFRYDSKADLEQMISYLTLENKQKAPVYIYMVCMKTHKSIITNITQCSLLFKLFGKRRIKSNRIKPVNKHTHVQTLFIILIILIYLMSGRKDVGRMMCMNDNSSYWVQQAITRLDWHVRVFGKHLGWGRALTYICLPEHDV